jgi:hypothetical protein
MASKAQMQKAAAIAAAAADQKRAARVAAIAAELRAAAQLEHDALVEQQTVEMASHQVVLAELDTSAASASAAVQSAQETFDAAARVLNGARTDEQAIAARRQRVTAKHIDAVRDASNALARLAPQLTDDFWLTEAESRVAADEVSS